MKVYGIKNCNTMKKAFDWLRDQDIAYEFHDYKKHSIDTTHLKRWIAAMGIEKIVNTRGMTYRKLDEVQKKIALENSAETLALLQEKTSMIKRPILEYNDSILLGFDDGEWSKKLK